LFVPLKTRVLGLAKNRNTPNGKTTLGEIYLFFSQERFLERGGDEGIDVMGVGFTGLVFHRADFLGIWSCGKVDFFSVIYIALFFSKNRISFSRSTIYYIFFLHRAAPGFALAVETHGAWQGLCKGWIDGRLRGADTGCEQTVYELGGSPAPPKPRPKLPETNHFFHRAQSIQAVYRFFYFVRSF